MKTTERLLQQLMKMEGLRLTAYKDAAGVPTIGYGHTKRLRGLELRREWEASRFFESEPVTDAEIIDNI